MEKRDMEEDFNNLPVGSTFEWCRLVFEIREDYSCSDCWFCAPERGCYFNHIDESTPFCSSFLRRDGKSVIFVKVGEVQD